MYATRFDAKWRWNVLVSLVRANEALGDAHKTLQAMRGGVSSTSTVYILHQACEALVKEFGEDFAALRNTPDPEARAFVCATLTALRGGGDVPLPEHWKR